MGSNALGIVWWLVWLGFGIYCIMDHQKYDEATYAAAGQQKQQTLIICILGTICCGFASLYYYFGIRPKLEAAQSGGAPTGYVQ